VDVELYNKLTTDIVIHDSHLNHIIPLI
jgi:hypothetical protein